MMDPRRNAALKEPIAKGYLPDTDETGCDQPSTPMSKTPAIVMSGKLPPRNSQPAGTNYTGLFKGRRG